MAYRLLRTFEATFRGRRYKHRNSKLGDDIAIELYEDLLDLGRSVTFAAVVRGGTHAVNVQNRRRGIRARRGDGTFGELVPSVPPTYASGFSVPRGIVATVEIGVEVKILGRSMLKQIDRVISDLNRQVEHFRQGGDDPISVGVVGVNHTLAPYTSYEGSRSYTTDGQSEKHPGQEAPQAKARLLQEVAPTFDEFLLLEFVATNSPPYPFSWLDERGTELDYGAALTRISREVERRNS